MVMAEKSDASIHVRCERRILVIEDMFTIPQYHYFELLRLRTPNMSPESVVQDLGNVSTGVPISSCLDGVTSVPTSSFIGASLFKSII